MLSVRLQDFKCFRDTGEIHIKPITFLVGENSSGKTSFLAALRLSLECFTSAANNPFNREPYFLGGFDQIAHASVGGRRRASSFCLSLTHNSPPSRGRNSLHGVRRINTTGDATNSHILRFGKGSPQPHLVAYSFRHNDLEAEFDLNGDHVECKIGGVAFKRKRELFLTPAAMIRENPSFLRYIFDEFIHANASRSAVQPPQKPDNMDALLKLAEGFRSARMSLGQRVFASAPVRSEPLRTYNPSEVAANAQGSHVPLELAGHKTRSPDRWEKVRQALSDFGQRAGLFDDIEIRQLGKKDGDPFQIEVKVGGPLVNIVDVGYGVSQALPIIYQIQNSRHYDAFLIQQPEVHLHPRAQAELGTLIGATAVSKDAPYFVIETHSDYILDRIRIEVQEGRVPHDYVGIHYFSRNGNDVRISQITLDENGELDGAPTYFREFFLSEHRRLLGL